MNRSTRTFLLFRLHLMRQFLITKFFNNTLLHSLKHFLSLMNRSTRTFLLFQFSFLIKSATKLFRFVTLTIILQLISINLFYSIFSKILINRFFFNNVIISIDNINDYFAINFDQFILFNFFENVNKSIFF